MKKFSYIWRMARRRKWSCLLVVLVTMGMTVFMLFYPSVIKNTRKKLNDTYKRITVSGSIEKIGTGDQMAVSGNVWKEMQSILFPGRSEFVSFLKTGDMTLGTPFHF